MRSRRPNSARADSNSVLIPSRTLIERKRNAGKSQSHTHIGTERERERGRENLKYLNHRSEIFSY